MARLRQLFPQNYGSSTNINTEFESVLRYLNAAELGNRTVAELLGQLFNDEGKFDGPIEMRRDPAFGLQYRVGEYARPEEGWTTLVSLAEIRGEPGSQVGEIGAPIFQQRADTVAAAAQTVVAYAHEPSDELLVHVNGLLKRPGLAFDYTSDAAANTVTFNSGLAADDVVTIYRVRSTAITGYRRSDILTDAAQAVFAFEFEPDTKLLVFKNGILQREGGLNDYTLQPASNTLTFTSTLPSGNLVSIVTVENVSSQAVTGLMLEGQYTDPATGLIPYAKLLVANDAIPQAKVDGLAAALSNSANIVISSSAPGSPYAGLLWLDTASAPNQLKYYDGVQWLRTSPESTLPTFITGNAGQYVRVNGTGTALEYAALDLSSAIPVTQKGAANGVAQLDSAGRLPASQLPQTLSSTSIFLAVGTPTNTSYTINRIFRQKLRIDGLALRVASGTCSVQITVNGVAVGETHAVSSTPTEFSLGSPIDIDSTGSSRTIGFTVSNNAASTGLEVVIAASVLAL
jgi:hypothetical protein